jgi:hypothetical protein
MTLTRILTVCAALLLAANAYAQETTTGSIAGQALDAQGLAVPGATVTISSTQGEKTFVTDGEGRFFAPFLTPGTYTVRVELTGFRTIERRDVAVSLGQRVELPLTLRVGGVTETVEVSAGSPVVDVTSTTTGATLDSELLAAVPVQRTFTDAVYLVPGVSTSGGVGRANPSISGGSGLENQYIVDGVNTTNTGYGAVGSYSIVFGSLGTGIPFDFLEEIQVKTGGYEAEFGQSTGGVVNVITKSGSNNFRGTAFVYSQLDALEGDFTPVISTTGNRAEAVNFTATQDSDVGFQIGGPIWRDRAFFFGAVDPQWQRTTLIAPEGFPLRDIGEVDRERRIVPYAAKATFQVTPKHRLDASFFGDPAEGEMGPQRRSALLRTDQAGFSSLNYGGHSQTLKWDGIMTPHWLLEASISNSTNIIEETPSVDEWSVRDNTVDPARRTGGIGFFEVGNDGRNLQFQVKSTNFWGDHEFRYGLLYEDIAYDNVINRTGPPITLPDGTVTATGANVEILPDPTFGRIFSVTRANITNVRETQQNYFTFFAQDTFQWRNFTFKPGIRYEQQKLVGNLEDFTWDNNWAPRLGVAWDPMGNGRTKIFGNWGRFFAKVPNDLAARALSADAGVTRADYFDAGLTRPVPNGVLAAGTTEHFTTAGLNASVFDPDSRSTYLDEWLVGAEHEIFRNVSAGVRYIHRDFGRVLEDVGTLPMVAYYLEDVPGADTVEYFITNPDASTPVAGDVGFPVSFEEAIHDYDAVELTLEKRFSDNWGAQASYRWSRLHGTFEGFFRNDNGQSDPAITSLFDFPTADPSYTAVGTPEFGFRGDIRFLGAMGAGPLPLDRPHHFKLFGNYLLPVGLNVGVGYQIGSGTPLTPLAANPVYRSAGEIPEGPRGSGFETTDGFRTRSEIEQKFDLHADYSFRLPGDRSITLLADVFNLFDTQNVLDYDNYTESTFGVLNEDFGRPILYQFPRSVRFGARFEF